MRRVILKRLHVLANIGILAHEMRNKQPLLITIVVDLPHTELLPKRDEIGCVFDYRQLRDIALHEVQRGHVHLLETLAGRIVSRLLELPETGRVLVRVDKPNVFPDCDAVGVEIERIKPVPEQAAEIPT